VEEGVKLLGVLLDRRGEVLDAFFDAVGAKRRPDFGIIESRDELEADRFVLGLGEGGEDSVEVEGASFWQVFDQGTDLRFGRAGGPVRRRRLRAPADRPVGRGRGPRAGRGMADLWARTAARWGERPLLPAGCQTGRRIQ